MEVQDLNGLQRSSKILRWSLPDCRYTDEAHGADVVANEEDREQHRVSTPLRTLWQFRVSSAGWHRFNQVPRIMFEELFFSPSL